jgi:hypothetical protein
MDWHAAGGVPELSRQDPRLPNESVVPFNRHVERVFTPDRKGPHWGKRKLKRDQ